MWDLNNIATFLISLMIDFICIKFGTDFLCKHFKL